MLEGAHLRFAMMPLATGGEAAQQALIIQKMQTFILYWKRQNLGLSVGGKPPENPKPRGGG